MNLVKWFFLDWANKGALSFNDKTIWNDWRKYNRMKLVPLLNGLKRDRMVGNQKKLTLCHPKPLFSSLQNRASWNSSFYFIPLRIFKQYGSSFAFHCIPFINTRLQIYSECLFNFTLLLELWCSIWKMWEHQTFSFRFFWQTISHISIHDNLT